MANQLYGKGRQAFLEGSIAILTDNIKCLLANSSSYTLAINSDQYVSDIPGGAIIARSPNLASKSSTLGVFNAATLTFSAVSGSAAAYLIGYKDTGTDATSPLIFNMDTATGLPVTPNGGDITVTWDTGSNKIFKLCEQLSEEDAALVRGGKVLDLIKAGLGWILPVIFGEPQIVQGPALLVPA